MPQKTRRAGTATGGVAILGVLVLAIAVGILLSAILAGEPSRPAHAGHGGPHLEQLARSQFVDEVRGVLMVRLEDDHPLRVIHVNDGSDAVVVKLTIPPGAAVNWHMHPAPVIGVVAEGELTITFGHDCIPRVYAAGSAWLHGAEAHPELAQNLGDEDMVMYGIFLGAPPGPVTVPADNPGC